jgi:hypothetical protein
MIPPPRGPAATRAPNRITRMSFILTRRGPGRAATGRYPVTLGTTALNSASSFAIRSRYAATLPSLISS